MCGFLGVIGPAPSDGLIEHYRKQAGRLSHRGNTDQSEWVGKKAYLHHHRLSFHDYDGGKQPFRRDIHAAPEPDALVYNGELYSFRAIRDTLSEYTFDTDSDTEVLYTLLHRFCHQGIPFYETLQGEFAFAYWSSSQQKLVLGRDPFGVKPIFFSFEGANPSPRALLQRYTPHYQFSIKGPLYFSSEIKGLPIDLTWDPEGVRRQFVGLYEEMGTPYQNVFQVPPGSLLIAEKKGLFQGSWDIRIERQTMLARQAPKKASRTHFDFRAAAHHIEEQMNAIIRDKLDSDVPLGLYLSSGIDSRFIGAKLAEQNYEAPTFTVGFEGAEYDETEAVRSFLQDYPALTPKFLHLTQESLQYSYPHAVYASEMIQPYTNGAAKWWLSLFARQSVQGVLTGDGADELFCGYPSFRYLAWWQWYQKNPKVCRQEFYEKRLGLASPWQQGLSHRSQTQDLEASRYLWDWAHPLYFQIKSLAQLFFEDESEALSWLEGLREDLLTYVQPVDEETSPLQQWQNYFLRTHLPTHILNWVGDRMEMANTLEGRPIYLDARLWNVVKTAPDWALVHGLKDKALLRQAGYNTLGPHAQVAKKQFNAAPIGLALLENEDWFQKNILDQSHFPIAPVQIRKAMIRFKDATDPLEQSFAQMFLQNVVAFIILQETIIEKKVPGRNASFEGNYLDTNTRPS